MRIPPIWRGEFFSGEGAGGNSFSEEEKGRSEKGGERKAIHKGGWNAHISQREKGGGGGISLSIEKKVLHPYKGGGKRESSPQQRGKKEGSFFPAANSPPSLAEEKNC